MAIREVGLREADDVEIWQYAVQNHLAILTKDEDFAERCLRERNPPGVIWLRIGNATNPVLPRWFMPLLPAVLVRVQSGDHLIEVR